MKENMEKHTRQLIDTTHLPETYILGNGCMCRHLNKYTLLLEELRMNNTPKRIEDCDKLYFYFDTIVSNIAKAIYELTPYIDNDMTDIIGRVMMDVTAEFNKSDTYPKAYFSNRRYLRLTKKEFNDWLHNTLFNSSAYKQLNLSYNERKKNIDVDDPNRAAFSFTSIYDKQDQDSWKDDFIDLDACIQNSMRNILRDMKDDGIDEVCTNNKPFGDSWTEWCSAPCANGIAICCKDCTYKLTCPSVCELSSTNNCSHLVKKESENNG